MWWSMSNHASQEKAEAWRAKFEVPPPGYNGSLEGTVWADDRMMDGYEQRL
jgi:hypothetical protein